MAKHSKKKIIFNFIEIAEAEEFLELVRRKKMYSNLTAKLNPSGKLELTLVGSPENIKITLQKLKKLHNTLLPSQQEKITPTSQPDEAEIDLKLKLKKLKFEET